MKSLILAAILALTPTVALSQQTLPVDPVDGPTTLPVDENPKCGAIRNVPITTENAREFTWYPRKELLPTEEVYYLTTVNEYINGGISFREFLNILFNLPNITISREEFLIEYPTCESLVSSTQTK